MCYFRLALTGRLFFLANFPTCEGKDIQKTDGRFSRVSSSMAIHLANHSSKKIQETEVYINHGGGPLPLLGKQPSIATFLGSYASTLPRSPTAILVVTAHWETGSQLKVSGGKTHSLYFDYGGFPKASLSKLIFFGR